MKTYTLATLALAAAASLGGCGGSKARGYQSNYSDSVSGAAAGSLEGPSHSVTSTSMGSMQGMDGMMGTRMIMDSMQSQMRMMQTMTPEHMKAMIPMHRRMVANMLSSFDESMRKMNMPGDAAWKALSDSIRQDLNNLPEMSGSQLRGFMTGHHSRLMRLVTMHESMTTNRGK